MSENRRRFSRIPFASQANLILPDGIRQALVIDISLKGALVRVDGDFFTAIGDIARLEISLDTEDTITMAVTIVHRQDALLGLACREIDLDSITHLRRLVQLNLGDEAMLDRNLAALVIQQQ